MTSHHAQPPSDDRPPGPAALATLTHHRWAMGILVALHTHGGGAKFITILKTLNISRDSLSRTLTALIELELIQRNPGYGHPMRPEYLLTSTGRRAGRLCDALMHLVGTSGQSDVLLRKWSLPIIAALDDGSIRYADIRRALPGITPRALTSTLKQLAEHGMLQRTVWDDSPPTVEYQLTSSARPLAHCLRPLCAAIARLLAGD